MLPGGLHYCFWDTDCASFEPRKYPQYTIRRILEYGNRSAVAWLQEEFSVGEICGVIRTERRLSPKSANFWGIVYGVPKSEIRALGEDARNACPAWSQRSS